MSIPATEKPEVRNESANGHSLFPAGQLIPFILVTALFFLWGIPSNLTDVLIRQFMSRSLSAAFRRGWCSRRFIWATFFWRCWLPCS